VIILLISTHVQVNWNSSVSQQAVMDYYTQEFKRQSILYLPASFKAIKPVVDSIQGRPVLAVISLFHLFMQF
jgi:hypothetical protein